MIPMLCTKSEKIERNFNVEGIFKELDILCVKEEHVIADNYIAINNILFSEINKNW